jgi:8-oxo-dGTP diphosphatase
MFSNDKISHLKFAVLATDVACFQIINNQLSVLLGKVINNSLYKNKWALIGGLILPSETAEKSVGRHLADKAGINNVYNEQLYTFSGIDRDPRNRVVSVAYMALASGNPQNLEKAKVETKWYSVSDVPNLAYDHNEILKKALDRLRSKITYTNIIQYLLPVEFTMSELQNAYESVLGKGLDKRNFRKKILAVNILKDTKQTRKEGVMRPATLYKFASDSVKHVHIL